MIAPISDRATFRALSRQGHHTSAPSLRLRAVFASDTSVSSGPCTSDPSVAFAISRRVGGAVTRNRLRRRLRAIIESWHRGEHGPLPAGAYLFIARSGAGDVTFADLEGQVHGLITAMLARHREML